MAQTTHSPAQGRELLLEVARRQFLERGYAQVSVQQIAEEAKMTKGAPYYHFANKQDLFIHVSLGIFVDLKRVLDTALQGEGSFQQRLERAIVDVVHSLSGDFSLWYSDLLRLDDKQHFAKSFEETFGASELFDIFVPEFERAKERGEITRVSAKAAATSYFLLLKATIDDCHHETMRHIDKPRELESFVSEIMDIYFHGIE